MLPENRGNALPAHHGDFCTNKLHRSHQRKGHPCYPEGGIAERCSGYGVGADSGWIVVRRPGYQARSEEFEQPDDGVRFRTGHWDLSVRLGAELGDLPNEYFELL